MDIYIPVVITALLSYKYVLKYSKLHGTHVWKYFKPNLGNFTHLSFNVNKTNVNYSISTLTFCNIKIVGRDNKL